MTCTTRASWTTALAAGLALASMGTLAIAQEERDDQQQRQARERDTSDRDASDRDQQRDDQSPRDRDDAFREPRQPDQDRRPAQNRQQGVMLGVAVEPSPTTGVLVREVLQGSAAEQAGLRPGDYILAIDDQRITDPQQFSQRLAQMQPGGQASLTIWRDEQEQQLSVNLVEQQQAGFRGQAQPGQPLDQGQQFRQGQPIQDGRTFQPGGRQQSQAWLGVILSEQQDDQQRGVRVMQVYPSGPAARAGLRSGDVITRSGDTQVSRADELVESINRRQPGEEIELTVLRGDEDEEPQEEALDVTLGDRSNFFGDDQFSQPGGQFGSRLGAGQFGDFDQFAVPEHAMMLEQHRHLASQHQRIERLLLELREEVQSLRQEVQALSGQRQGRGAGGASRTVPGLPQPPDDAAEFGQPGPQQRRALRPGLEAAPDRGLDEQPQPRLNPPSPSGDNRASPNATAR